MPESQALINILNKSFDTVTESIRAININKAEVSKGNVYTKTITATKTAAQFLNVHLKKGSAGDPARHMRFEISCQTNSLVYLYEMIKTSGAGGTTFTLLNNNRVSTKASSFRIVQDKTTFSSSTGTLLMSYFTPVGAGVQKYTKSLYSETEWVLKSTKEYLIRVDPAANSTGINVAVTWYEDI